MSKETEKIHFEQKQQQDELDRKLAEKVQAEEQPINIVNNNQMTEQERIDFELAQKLQNELDQQNKPEPVKPKQGEATGEICLSEHEQKMFEYFKKKKEQEEIDRKLGKPYVAHMFINSAEELAKQLEEEDKKYQQQRKDNANNNTAQNNNNNANKEPRKDDLKIRDNAENNEKTVSKHVVEIEYPNYWQKQVTDQQLFTLDRNSNEFQSIADRFNGTVPGEDGEYTETKSNYYITKIQRNQNRYRMQYFIMLTQSRRLWMWYLLRKKEVQETSKTANEKFLFHGSAEENYDAILKEGLDLRLANAGGSIGDGISFVI